MTIKFPVVIVTPMTVELVADDKTLRLKNNFTIVKTNAKPIDRVIAQRTFDAVRQFS